MIYMEKEFKRFCGVCVFVVIVCALMALASSLLGCTYIDVDAEGSVQVDVLTDNDVSKPGFGNL